MIVHLAHLLQILTTDLHTVHAAWDRVPSGDRLFATRAWDALGKAPAWLIAIKQLIGKRAPEVPKAGGADSSPVVQVVQANVPLTTAAKRNKPKKSGRRSNRRPRHGKKGGRK